MSEWSQADLWKTWIQRTDAEAAFRALGAFARALDEACEEVLRDWARPKACERNFRPARQSTRNSP